MTKLSKNLHCQHCNSTNIYAIDNQPLDHSKEWLKEGDRQFDSEIYIEFGCDDCKKSSTYRMDIVPIVNVTQNEQEEAQMDTVTVFKTKLDAFAKAAEELDNAWDYVDGDPDVAKAIDIRWPFLERLYYLALKDTRNWAKKTAENLNKK